MGFGQRWLSKAALLSLVLYAVIPAEASSFRRASLDRLTDDNESILIAKVLDAESYWNAEETMILTDVHLEVLRSLKGTNGISDVTLTLMGGTVGDTSTVIVGGATLVPETMYVLFVNREDLPGAEGVLTIRDHAQGTFEVSAGTDGLKAMSQARDEALVPDEGGQTDVPFGSEGVAIEVLVEEIRALLGTQEEN